MMGKVKNRTVPIPDSLVPELGQQLKSVIVQYEKDCQTNYDGVFLPDLLSQKYKNAAKELPDYPRLSATMN